MQFAQPCFQSRIALCGGLDDGERLLTVFQFAFPAVEGLDARYEVDARSKTFTNECLRGGTCGGSVRERGEHDEELHSINHQLRDYSRLLISTSNCALLLKRS